MGHVAAAGGTGVSAGSGGGKDGQLRRFPTLALLAAPTSERPECLDSRSFGTKTSGHNIAVKNGRMRPRQKRVSFGRTDGGGNVRFEPDPDFTQQVREGKTLDLGRARGLPVANGKRGDRK